MRIALAAAGTRGDVHPLLDLACTLAAGGHDPVVCATPDARADVEARGVAFRPVGEDVRVFLTQNADVVTSNDLRTLRTAYDYMQRVIAHQFAALPEAAQGADLVVGGGVQVAGPSIAEALGVPYRYVAYCPIMFRSAEHPAVIMPFQGLPRWLNRLSWRLFGFLNDRLVLGELNRARARLGLAPVRDAYRYIVGERALLAADPGLCEAPADATESIEQISCLHRVNDEPLPPKLASFLDAGPAPLYIGFGSMTDPDAAATTRLLLDAVRATGCRALLSEGWAGLGSGPLPEGVETVGSVSHTRLFPRVAAVVHHGGAGTTTAAARAGVPQLVVPHVADQFWWGRRVWSLGLGPPPLKRTRLDATTLAAALGELLGNELLVERAAELGARLRARLDPLADADRLLAPTLR